MAKYSRNEHPSTNDVTPVPEGALPGLPAVSAFFPSPVIEALPLPSEFEGQKSYRLRDNMYRDGEMYQPGDCLNVTDEVPGRSWEPIRYNANLRDVTRLRGPVVRATTNANLTDPSGAPARASDRDL